MPYTEKQNALFRAAAHNKAISQSSGIPQQQAAKMASEGVINAKPMTKRRKRAMMLMGKE